MTSCIHFIRHGITEGVANKWYYGWADLPLIEEGVNAIAEFKSKNIYPSPEGADFYTSGMVRANQTLQVIFGDVPYKSIENLKEMNFGDWECKTFNELKELEGFDIWINDTTGTFRFPGGESASDFYERTNRGLKELLGYHRLREFSHRHSGKDSVSIVVCHGGVIAAAMCSLLGRPQETFWELIPAPGRGYTIYFENSTPIRFEEI